MKLDLLSGGLVQFQNAVTSRKYQAAVSGVFGTDPYTLYRFFLGPGGTANVFQLTDATLSRLLSDVATVPLGQEAAAMRKVTQRLDQLEWIVPIGEEPGDIDFVASSVRNVPATGDDTQPYAFGSDSSEVWFTK